ncbi:hypothetical protein GCM10009093_12140 [Brevundimonas terrae]|uniref:RES domain-containing protein n=1 Tax=Brevundimonas terrae TaxID=363631 RepID=A0ABP3I2B0_9CAUL|nr:RES family NAD+ phosphorylase [Brevundimonas terrae]
MVLIRRGIHKLESLLVKMAGVDVSNKNRSGAEFAHWDSYSRFVKKVRYTNRYILEDEERRFLDAVLATIRDRDEDLKVDHILYRAQRGIDIVDRTDEDGNWIGEDVWGYGSSRMKPLADRAREGRANPMGIPVLYVASTIETAVSEVRPWVGSELSVAKCRVVRPLRTLDLSVGHGQSPFAGAIFRYLLNEDQLNAEEKKKAVWTQIDNAFSEPVTASDERADYAPTQILAELFRSAGYDAIAYKSHFGDQENIKGYNIAIFDPSTVEIVSCTPYRVNSIKVAAEPIGNPWFKSHPGH